MRFCGFYNYKRSFANVQESSCFFMRNLQGSQSCKSFLKNGVQVFAKLHGAGRRKCKKAHRGTKKHAGRAVKRHAGNAKRHRAGTQKGTQATSEHTKRHAGRHAGRQKRISDAPGQAKKHASGRQKGRQKSPSGRSEGRVRQNPPTRGGKLSHRGRSWGVGLTLSLCRFCYIIPLVKGGTLYIRKRQQKVQFRLLYQKRRSR